MKKQPESWFKMNPSLPTPKSTTRESLEAGRKLQTKVRIVSRKQLNFVSYPMNDFRFDIGSMQAAKPVKHDVCSVYKRDYVPPYLVRCKTKGDEVKPPDWLFNRKPINSFDIDMSTCGPNKFIDDHLIDVSQARLKTNFFRQLRNRSSIYGDG